MYLLKCISIYLPAQHINVDIISVATLFFGHKLNINFEIKNFQIGTIFNFMNERYTKNIYLLKYHELTYHSF